MGASFASFSDLPVMEHFIFGDEQIHLSLIHILHVSVDLPQAVLHGFQRLGHGDGTALLHGGYAMPGLVNLHVHLAGNGKPPWRSMTS